MIPQIKKFLEEEGSVVLHFNNGESVEINSLEVWGAPNHTYHAVSRDNKKLFFDSPDVISFVMSK